MLPNKYFPNIWKAENIKKLMAAFLAGMMLLTVNPVFAASLDEINQQINNLNQRLDVNQNQQNSLQDTINRINAQIDQLQLEIQATQAQIDQTNAQIVDTNNQITKVQADLVEQRKIMAEYLKTMYIDGQTSLVEQLASSKSFSDFVDKDEYVSTMQKKVKETQDKIVQLENDLKNKKQQLEDQKTKAEQLQASQVAQQSAIVAQRNYQATLLANAQAAANAMSNQRDALYAQKAQLSQSYGEIYAGGSSSYPYGNPPAAYRIDAPDAYGYLIGECTSYVAWKRASIGRAVPRAMGNANMWPGSARANGMSVNQSPRVGDVMVFPYIGGYGHVAYVEAVYGNGTVLISEYNWTPYRFSQRVVNPWNYGAVFIH